LPRHRSLLSVVPQVLRQLRPAGIPADGGRLDEAAAALETLARSDSGAPWRTAVARERDRIAAARRPADAAAPHTLLVAHAADDLSHAATSRDKAA
ncbi:MAG: hypothetical protein ACKOWG_14100, partial [Planctomycetia bacterium]